MKLVAIASLITVGCVTEPAEMSAPEPTAPPVATGTYHVRTTIDLTVDALLPAAIHDKVRLLRAFSQDPARTLFDVAEEAGVPAVGELRDALPAYVEDELYGWIDDEIAALEVEGVTVTQHAANLAAFAEQSLGTFALDSSLTVRGAAATHVLERLDLHPAGLGVSFPLSALPNTTASATCSSTDGTFAIGAHGFSMPYGEYAWEALAAYVDIRASIGAAVRCEAIAAGVADNCVLGVCVGHAPALTEICERGLDEIVERIHDEFTATRLDLLQLDGGTAAITEHGLTGVWAARIDLGQGLRDAPATFRATR